LVILYADGNAYKDLDVQVWSCISRNDNKLFSLYLMSLT